MTPSELKTKKQNDKRRRLVVTGTVNRLKSWYSLKQISTWGDVYRTVGYDENYIKSQTNSPNHITFDELRKYCKGLEDNLEQQLSKENDDSIQRVNGAQIKDQEVGQSIPLATTTTNVVLPVSNVEVIPLPSKNDSSDESGFNNSNDYGLQPSPKEKAFLFWFQKKAVRELFEKIVNEHKPGVMLIASTGTGKTFIQGALDRRLKDISFADDKTWGHVKTLAITRNSVVEQTKRVLQNQFCINPVVETEVLNIEKLRTRAGQIWLQEIQTIVNGEEVTEWRWKPMINPAVIMIDECQAVKNATSTQSQIITAASKLENVTQVFISATPFARVSEARAFAIATKKDISHLGFPPGTRLSAETWGTYSAVISSPSAPDEYNEAAVDRLMTDLNDYIVRVKGVRWQFNAINSVEIIDFENDQQAKEYDDAWKKFLAKKATLEESVTDNPRFQAMIELGVFLSAAEYAKRHIFARRMYHDVQNGYAAVCAVKQKRTIIAVVQILVSEYGVSRDQISLIWGGGQTQMNQKQKLKAQIKAKKDLFDEKGIELDQFLKDMMLDEVEDREMEELAPELRLGNQSKDERQREIDKFQSGRSLYCIYTYKAGGVGLSLHHTDEQTKEKVRRQKNGYAVVEDIPKIPTRPRRVTVGPTWSPMELVQGCGRCPRLTSLSDTIQKFLYFRGTVEEDQAFVVTHRLKCLSKVVRQHEDWMDLIRDHGNSKKIATKRVEELKEFESDEPPIDVGIVSLEEED